MDESAPKRRRVSPRGAGATSQVATPESHGRATRRKRPSFASPTKASLARHNPQILERRQSASPAKPAGSRPAGSRPAVARRNPDNDESLLARPATAENVAASELGNEPQPTESGPAPERPVRPGGGGGSGPATRRPLAKPNPRPLPPPAPDGEDELNPFIGHTTLRAPNTGVSIPPPPEPELPPAVPDPVSSTPPRGIHSSPSRWRERSKAKKSSPLKPLPERPGAAPSKQSALAIRGFLREAGNSGEPLHDAALDPTTSRSRRVAALDPNEAKKRERNELLAEIAGLRRDLETAVRENERIRLMQSSGRTVAPTNEDGVMDLMRRCLVSPEEAPPPAPSHQLLQAVLNPMGVLPFGRPWLLASAPDEQDDLAKIKSHHPTPMTADEELPYLQLFSPFSVNSTMAVLPPLPDMPLRQRRLVTLRSRDVPGLFTAKLEMVVNAMNLSILGLSVLSLEPSARFELGPFTDEICTGKCNRTMQRNVGILSWAMGEWYRVAVQRARFWYRLEQRLGSKERLLECVSETRARRRRQNDAESEHDEKGPATCDKADLIRLLGQQSFEVKVPDASGSGSESALRLEWKIGFDWTGEAQSTAAIMVGVPGEWREADKRGVFGKLPRLFEDLVRGGQDAEVAVRTVAALLAGP